MKKSILALLLAAGVAQAGEYDGAYHCTAQNKIIGSFFTVVVSNSTGTLIVAACPSDCPVTGYMIGQVSGGTFTGTNESLLKMTVNMTATGYTYTDVFTGFTPTAITSPVTCTKVW